ncbi:unnamed protein product [Mycena citricolor]|uniref:Uncharacterized protein n=1 Tax=Mycena citricolor TaxID=2018698 RepID=A0AAD2HCC5_9AGAR|nr:unnamed protein product [Mycena citricolor]
MSSQRDSLPPYSQHDSSRSRAWAPQRPQTNDRSSLLVPGASPRLYSERSVNNTIVLSSTPTWKLDLNLPFLVLLVVQFLLICFALTTWPVEAALDPQQRIILRRSWAAEASAHEELHRAWSQEERDQETLRTAWRQEVLEQEARRVRWAHERDEEEHRHERELERIRAGFSWTSPIPDAHCASYGARQWSSRITNVPRTYDPVQACMETAVEINGAWIRKPDFCEDRGCNGVFGHWLVHHGESSCSSYFRSFVDKGCTAGGSQLRRIESRLENVQSGDDWRVMCDTTPADFGGQHFDHPDMCEQSVWGIWGNWFLHDQQC